MKSKLMMQVRLLAVCGFVALSTPLLAQVSAPAPTGDTIVPFLPPQVPSLGGYAEGIYQEYAAATDGRVSFQVQTLEQGPLSQLAGRPFNTFLVPPAYRLESNQVGTQLRSAFFFVPPNQNLGRSEMSASVDKFNTVGLPVSLGSFRRLGVTATIGGDSRFHEAMEFCWVSLSQCKVLDPVIVFLQSKVNNRARLAAEGWGSRVNYIITATLPTKLGPTGQAIVGGGGGGVCGLASNHGATGTSVFWGAYTVQYTDVFGIVLVSKSLGSQNYGLSCDVNCNPHVFASSNSSSGWGTGGWNVACANTPNSAVGITGSQGKTIAETKCTHSWVASASASVSIAGAGSVGVSANWSLGGGVDSNGGQLADSCGIF